MRQTKQTRLDAIRKEVNNAERAIKFLQPGASNRDFCEMEIRREAMRRIDLHLGRP